MFMMKKSTLKLVLVVVILFVAELVFAQSMPAPQRAPGPPGLPIDGGLLALMSVAFGYGVSKLRERK